MNVTGEIEVILDEMISNRARFNRGEVGVREMRAAYAGLRARLHAVGRHGN